MIVPRPARLAKYMVLALALSCAAAGAQPHEEARGRYVLRGSTVSSLQIDAKTARAHGIERDRRHAVLNAVVLQDGHAVAAEVTATARSLAGRSEKLNLR